MKYTSLILFSILFMCSCKEKNSHQKLSVVDNKLTKETYNLYNNLYELGINKKVLLGQQDATVYGIGWFGDENRSDVKSVCGSNVAVYGWDISGLEIDSDVNIDGVPFDRIKREIVDAYKRGGVNTISWHTINPVDGSDSWNVGDSIVKRLLINGDLHHLYISWLDKVSTFITSLKDDKGEAIPIIFRPFHENNGKWFWWGAPYCTPKEYTDLWKFTVNYLKDTKGIHNLLYSFSPNFLASEDEYLEYYPGDDYVDIWGTDSYCINESQYKSVTKTAIVAIGNLAKKANKPFALTETGYESIKNPLWWSEVLLPLVENTGMCYVLVWRNAFNIDNHYYAPYPGHASADNFIEFVNNPNIYVENEMPNMYK